MNQFSANLATLSGVNALADHLVSLLALAMSTGEAFLPDAKSYDDLFYKVLESGDALIEFRDAYGIKKRSSAAAADMLIGVSVHYKRLLEEQKGKGNKHPSPREVGKVIKQGYETLNIQTKEGLDNWDRYREADHRNLIKRVTRCVVIDVRVLLAERQ